MAARFAAVSKWTVLVWLDAAAGFFFAVSDAAAGVCAVFTSGV